MSADNYLLIKKVGKKYRLIYGVASNDYQSEKGEFDSLEKAIKASEDYDTEYGLRFVLEDTK